MRGRKPIHPRPYPRFRDALRAHRTELGGRYLRWTRGQFGKTGQFTWACEHPECLIALYNDIIENKSKGVAGEDT